MTGGTWLKKPATLCDLLHEVRLFFGLFSGEGMIRIVEREGKKTELPTDYLLWAVQTHYKKGRSAEATALAFDLERPELCVHALASLNRYHEAAACAFAIGKPEEAILMYHNARMYKEAAEVAQYSGIDYTVVNE